MRWPSGRETLLWALLSVTACTATPQPARTQLEVREAQTRTFDTADTKLVMKAMLNVLQDEGYVVKNAVVDLGLITASKEVDLAPGRNDDVNVFGSTTVILGGGPGGIVFGGGDGGTWRKTEVIDCTSNVSEYGEQTRVRLSFQRKVIDNRGATMSSEPLEDPAFYQEFFSKVDKAIFLQKEDL
jgi:hypothetical protein